MKVPYMSKVPYIEYMKQNTETFETMHLLWLRLASSDWYRHALFNIVISAA